MLFLTYNNVTLSFERTTEFSADPVYSPDGTDLLFHKFTFAATCIWNPATIAQPGDQPITPFGGSVNPNNTLGNMVKNLQFALLEPRKPLTLVMGNDAVVVLPGVIVVGGQDQAAPCDANYGPIPQYCRVQEVLGLKTAIVNYRIVFHLSTCVNIILSNRWSVSASIDAEGFTTRVIRGKTIVRADVVANQTLTVDQFRKALLVPPPYSFQRMKIDVSVGENGTQLDWTVLDQETWLGIGNDNAAARIEGSVTCGIESPIRRLSDSYRAAQQLIPGTHVDSTADVLRSIPGIFGALISIVPVATASGIVRVYGRASSSKAAMANIAVNIIADRFMPLQEYNQLHIATINVTQDVMRPEVEVRIEFYANMTNGGMLKLSELSIDDLGGLSRAQIASFLEEDDLFTKTEAGLLAGAIVSVVAADLVYTASLNAYRIAVAAAAAVSGLNPVADAAAATAAAAAAAAAATDAAIRCAATFNNVLVINGAAQRVKTRMGRYMNMDANITGFLNNGQVWPFINNNGTTPNALNILTITRGSSRPMPRPYISDANANVAACLANGSWLGDLMTQVLNAPCKPPTAPPLNQAGLDRDPL